MLLIDEQIRELCLTPNQDERMIEPFSEGVSGPDIISYGLSSAGYDIRLGGEIWVYKATSGEVVDPKRFRCQEYRERMFDHFVCLHGQQVIIPAGGYVLGTSLEYFRMPSDVMATCLGKSTYARIGISINVTPLEPGWKGTLTIEIENANPGPACVYVGEGIAQLLFFKLPRTPQKTYDKRSGRYQNQSGVTPPRLE